MAYPKYYLAYGSNLNLAQMKRRCPTSKKVGTALIKGYRLLFKRTYLTIEPAEGYEVPVGVFEIQAGDERALDYYEGYPDFYYKKGFEIVLNGSSRRLNAFAYSWTNPIVSSFLARFTSKPSVKAMRTLVSIFPLLKKPLPIAIDNAEENPADQPKLDPVIRTV